MAPVGFRVDIREPAGGIGQLTPRILHDRDPAANAPTGACYETGDAREKTKDPDDDDVPAVAEQDERGQMSIADVDLGEGRQRSRASRRALS